MAVTADMVERPGGKARHISYTLPAWTCNNAEFFDLEREHIFMRTWQLVRHVSEVAEPGDYATLGSIGGAGLRHTQPRREAARSYSTGVLCAKEVCVKQFHDGTRAVLPVAGCIEPPEPGSMVGLDSQRTM